MTATELWDIFEEEGSLLEQAERARDFEVYGLTEAEAEKLDEMLQNWQEQYESSEPDDYTDLIEIIDDEESLDLF